MIVKSLYNTVPGHSVLLQLPPHEQRLEAERVAGPRHAQQPRQPVQEDQAHLQIFLRCLVQIFFIQR